MYDDNWNNSDFIVLIVNKHTRELPAHINYDYSCGISVYRRLGVRQKSRNPRLVSRGDRWFCLFYPHLFGWISCFRCRAESSIPSIARHLIRIRCTWRYTRRKHEKIRRFRENITFPLRLWYNIRIVAANYFHY